MIEKYSSRGASPVRQKESAVKAYAASPALQKRFADVLGKKAPAFIASVIGSVNANPKLQACDPVSVFGSAMIAATLDLSVVPTLGQAAIVPYKGNVQFQVMTRGLVQLAQRTGQYKCINAGVVYEDEYDGEDLLTGEVMFHRVKGGYRDQGDESKIIGYFAFIETITGFRKTEYWTKADVENHAKRYSKSYNNGPWQDNFHAMAKKTVLKSLLNHYGPMSVDSQLAMAMAKDQMINSHGTDSYEDNIADDLIVDGPASSAAASEEPDGGKPIAVTESGEIIEESIPTQPEGPESFEDDSSAWGDLDQAWESGQSL